MLKVENTDKIELEVDAGKADQTEGRREIKPDEINAVVGGYGGLFALPIITESMHVEMVKQDGKIG